MADGGKKGRKIGHNKSRSLAMARYRSELRWERNKARKIETNQRREVAARAKHRRKNTLGYRARQIARNKAIAA